MTYTAPDATNADFSLQGYAPPEGDAVNFDLTEALHPRPAQLDADDREAEISPVGIAVVAPPPAALESSAEPPSASGEGEVTIQADAATLSLGQPDTRVFYTISPPAAELELDPQAFGIDPDAWQIDNYAFEPRPELTLTPRTLSIPLYADRDTIDHWRQYDRAGDVRVSVGFAGAFRAIDRGGRSEMVRVEPKPSDAPPFDDFEGHVNSYEEQQVAADRYEITLTIQRETNREDAFAEIDESGAYELDLERGTIGLEHTQVRQTSGTGTATGGQRTLSLELSDAQAGALADAAGYPDAAVRKTVTDGEDRLSDETDGRQTVTLSTPADASLPTGEYIVQGWTVSWDNHGEHPWLAELQIAETD